MLRKNSHAARSNPGAERNEPRGGGAKKNQPDSAHLWGMKCYRRSAMRDTPAETLGVNMSLLIASQERSIEKKKLTEVQVQKTICL